MIEPLLTISFSILIATLISSGDSKKLHELLSVFGFIAYGALNVLAITSVNYVRTRYYRVFLMAHIVRFILAMVFMALHQPSMIVGIIIAASFWLSDRIYRAGRMVLHSRATMVKLKPLPGDAVKLVFTKPMGFKPGAHAFIYIPEISKLESHPFYFSSAPSSNSMEMLIRVNGDWTKELHRYVSERYSEDRLHRPLNQPELKVWVDGPYGGPPKLDTNNKTLLIADGAGASFLFSVAGQLSSRAQGGSHVRAVWFIRDEGKYSFIG